MDGAKLILNSRYFRVAKSGNNNFTKEHAAYLVEYVGTRESVSLNSDNVTAQIEKATEKQKHTIEVLKEKCRGDYKDTHEYADYLKTQSKAAASQLISRLSELTLLENGVYTDDGLSPQMVSYVGTRPSVDIKKGQQHGLFSSYENVDLKTAMDEISNHKGNVWTHVISLRREDADRLGYNSQEPWKQLVRNKANVLAKAHKIKFENLRWYAGMHNTGYHPHIHLFIYSNNPKEGYINDKGLKDIKAAFATEIFKDDLKYVYTAKTEYRNEIKKTLDEIVNRVNAQPIENIDDTNICELSQKLYNLSKKMPLTGRYYYKYQSKEIKSLVDKLLNDLVLKSPELNKLYSIWEDQQQQVLKTYIKAPNYNVSISDNDNFKFMKNTLLKKARELQGIVQEEIHAKEKDFSIIADEPQNIDDNLEEKNNLEDAIQPPDDICTTEYCESEKSSTYENAVNFLSMSEKFLELVDNAHSSGEAAYKVAIAYLYGYPDENIKRNIETAKQFLFRADYLGNPYATYQLSKMHFDDNRERDPKIRSEFAMKAFDGFNAYLGEKYPKLYDALVNGYGVEEAYDDIEEDERYSAANLVYNIGKMHYKGEGTSQNFLKAKKFFVSSCKKVRYANIYLGNIALYGQGEKINYADAKVYYSRALQSKNEMTVGTAAFKLAYIYESVDKDFDKAGRYYFLSAKSNNADAHYKLAKLLEQGKFKIDGINENGAEIFYKKAYDLYIKQEKQFSDSNTKINIANLLLAGKGVNKNENKAIDWLKQAEKDGSAVACQHLANIYANKESNNYNIDTAISYLNKATELSNDNHIASYQLGLIYSDTENTNVYNLEKAVSFFKISSNAGNHYASYHLGKIYSDPESDYFNLDKAVAALKVSADKGNHYASYHLGKIYADWESNYFNPDKAVAALKVSADKGNHYASYHLGKIYSDPESNYFNLDKAVAALKVSADKGNHYASYHLGKIYADPESNYFNLDKAVAALKVSADKGNHYASYHLGKIYADPESNYFNLDKAVAALKVSADKGNHYASYHLGKIYADPESNYYNLAKAIEYFGSSAKDGNVMAEISLNRCQYRLESNSSQPLDIAYDSLKTSTEILNGLSSIVKLLAKALRNNTQDCINNRNNAVDKKVLLKRKQKEKQTQTQENEFNMY